MVTNVLQTHQSLLNLAQDSGEQMIRLEIDAKMASLSGKIRLVPFYILLVSQPWYSVADNSYNKDLVNEDHGTQKVNESCLWDRCVHCVPRCYAQMHDKCSFRKESLCWLTVCAYHGVEGMERIWL